MGLTALNCGITCNFHFILYHCFPIYAPFHCIIYTTCICSYINVCQLLSFPISYQLLTLRCFIKVITVHGCFLLPKCLYDPDHFTSARLLHTWDVIDGLLLARSPKNGQRSTSTSSSLQQTSQSSATTNPEAAGPRNNSELLSPLTKCNRVVLFGHVRYSLKIIYGP